MTKQKMEYYVYLPTRLDVLGYGSLEYSGRTMAHSKAQAVSQFVFRQDKSNFRLVLDKLKEKYGCLEIFAEEKGVSLKSLGLENVGVEQTEEDLKKGKKLIKFEKELLREYELARVLAERDNVDSLTNPRTLFYYLNSARNLL